MKSRMLARVFAACATLVAATAIADHVPGSEAMPLGAFGKEIGATRTIAVDSGSRYLTVTRGDTVTFVNGAKRFTWVFDTYEKAPIRLSRIAPSDFGSGHLTVYVVSHPRDVANGS